MLPLRLAVFLLGLATSGLCCTVQDDPELDNTTDIDPEGRSMLLGGFNLFEVLKKLDICYLKCNENYCECCQKIKILLIKIEVCATVEFKKGDKNAQAGLKVSGIHLVSTKVKLEGHGCIPVSTKIGPLEVCFETKVLRDQPHLNSFPVCINLMASYEGVPSVLLTFGCEDGHATENLKGDYRTTGVLKVLNGDEVAKAINKLIADDAAPKN